MKIYFSFIVFKWNKIFINDNQYWLLQHVMWTHLHPEVFYICNASQHALQYIFLL